MMVSSIDDDGINNKNIVLDKNTNNNNIIIYNCNKKIYVNEIENHY